MVAISKIKYFSQRVDNIRREKIDEITKKYKDLPTALKDLENWQVP